MVREPSSNRHERLGWIIGEVYDPGLDMVIDEVRRPLCRANTDMEMFNLPTAAQNWKCEEGREGGGRRGGQKIVVYPFILFFSYLKM